MDSKNFIPASARIYDGEFFEVINSEGDILVVRCNLCTADGHECQLLRTSVKSNGNILKHIKRRHMEHLDRIKATKGIKSRQSRGPRQPDQLNGKWNVKTEGKDGAKKMKFDDEDLLVEMNALNSERDRKLEFVSSNEPNNDMYVVEPIPQEIDSDEEYVEFEVETSKNDERNVDCEEVSMDDPEYDIEQLKHQRKETAMFNVMQATNRAPVDRSLIELQKTLMKLEYEEIRKMRVEKHQLEVAILKAELAHKTMEHQKRMEVLNKNLSES